MMLLLFCALNYSILSCEKKNKTNGKIGIGSQWEEWKEGRGGGQCEVVCG